MKRIVLQTPLEAEEKELLAETNVSSILGEVVDWYVLLDVPWLGMIGGVESDQTGLK